MKLNLVHVLEGKNRQSNGESNHLISEKGYSAGLAHFWVEGYRFNPTPWVIVLINTQVICISFKIRNCQYRTLPPPRRTWALLSFKLNYQSHSSFPLEKVAVSTEVKRARRVWFKGGEAGQGKELRREYNNWLRAGWETTRAETEELRRLTSKLGNASL